MLTINNEMSKSNIKFITIQNTCYFSYVFCFNYRLFVYSEVKIAFIIAQKEIM